MIVPIVTGSVDYDLLDQLARDLAAGRCGPSAGASSSEAASQPAQTGPPDKANRAASQPVGTGRPEGASQAAGTEPPGSDGQPELAAVMGRGEAAARTGQVTARELALSQAIALLSGPAGLASRLRRGRLTGPAATVSLPLDTGAATEIVPPHLRRAVIVRDRHCAFAGCEQPPAVCQVHHVIPRSQGGPTALTNLVLLCSFHHLTAVHRWGWAIALHADGTTTAISPDRSRVLNDQGPPRRAA